MTTFTIKEARAQAILGNLEILDRMRPGKMAHMITLYCDVFSTFLGLESVSCIAVNGGTEIF